MWREIKKFFLSYNSKNFVCKQSRRTNLKLLKYARTLFSISEDVHTHTYIDFSTADQDSVKLLGNHLTIYVLIYLSLSLYLSI